VPVGDAFHIRIYDTWASSSSKSKTYFRMRSVLSRSSRLSSERSFLGCAVIVRNAGRVVCQTEVAPYDQRGEGLKKRAMAPRSDGHRFETILATVGSYSARPVSGTIQYNTFNARTAFRRGYLSISVGGVINIMSRR